MAGAFRAAVPRIDRTEACGWEAAALQAPQAHGRSGEARPGRGAHEGRALVPGADIEPHLGGAPGARRER
jgi:hypothetical protein